MKLLLDTHTFLWYADGSPKMSVLATELLIDPTHELFLSMASAWEIAIKVGLRKLVLSSPLAVFMQTAIAGYGLNVVPITVDDCTAYESLPFPSSHRDPFDRLLVAQAQRHGLSIVGADTQFDVYGVPRLW